MSKRVCMVVTDAISFNVLCRGQLEFIRDNYNVELVLVSGGAHSELNKLKSRGVGEVVFLPMVRKPSLSDDMKSAFKIFLFLCRNRFDIVIYSTPKAMF